MYRGEDALNIYGDTLGRLLCEKADEGVQVGFLDIWCQIWTNFGKVCLGLNKKYSDFCDFLRILMIFYNKFWKFKRLFNITWIQGDFSQFHDNLINLGTLNKQTKETAWILNSLILTSLQPDAVDLFFKPWILLGLLEVRVWNVKSFHHSVAKM